ncbi:DNA-directed RNA polymerases II, IV and V subunit 8B [Glycine max]|nr:DNA-directed RNA polymerases II, IV and V subunit 8B [Glycine max]
MQTVCCFTGLNASNRLKTNWLIKTFSTKAHTSLLTHSAAHTKPFLSHSLGKREASTVCTVGASSTAATCGGGQGSLRSWSSHRAEKLLCIALGRKTLAAISTTAQPHTSETPPQSGGNIKSSIFSNCALHTNATFRTDTAFRTTWMSELLFDDIFKVEKVDPDGKKYDKVSRIVARSEKCDMNMLLDVNTEIYPMGEKERFLMALSPSLVLNTKDGSVSIQDKFEYIMHGRLYNITKPQLEKKEKKEKRSESQPEENEECSKPQLEVEVYASFGGLQLMLKGHASHCVKFAVDQKLFLLIRKVES